MLFGEMGAWSAAFVVGMDLEFAILYFNGIVLMVV